MPNLLCFSGRLSAARCGQSRPYAQYIGWGNGKEFYEMAGSIIRLPAAKRNRPSRDSIEWHMDTTFRAR